MDEDNRLAGAGGSLDAVGSMMLKPDVPFLLLVQVESVQVLKGRSVACFDSQDGE